MPSHARVSIHLELFRHWDAKRAGRTMPARRDIDPSEMPAAVIRNVAIIDQIDGRFRYRLVGTGVAKDLGRDFTGGWVGSYTSSTEYAAAAIAIYERVFASGRPIFTTGEHKTGNGIIQNNSRLILPLSNDGEKVNMVIFSRVARFNRSVAVGFDWTKGTPGKVSSVVDVATAEEIEKHCLQWSRHCLSSNAAVLSA
jgi:hypothetical protein